MSGISCRPASPRRLPSLVLLADPALIVRTLPPSSACCARSMRCAVAIHVLVPARPAWGPTSTPRSDLHDPGSHAPQERGSIRDVRLPTTLLQCLRLAAVTPRIAAQVSKTVENRMYMRFWASRRGDSNP